MPPHVASSMLISSASFSRTTSTYPSTFFPRAQCESPPQFAGQFLSNFSETLYTRFCSNFPLFKRHDHSQQHQQQHRQSVYQSGSQQQEMEYYGNNNINKQRDGDDDDNVDDFIGKLPTRKSLSKLENTNYNHYNDRHGYNYNDRHGDNYNDRHGDNHNDRHFDNHNDRHGDNHNDRQLDNHNHHSDTNYNDRHGGNYNDRIGDIYRDSRIHENNFNGTNICVLSPKCTSARTQHNCGAGIQNHRKNIDDIATIRCLFVFINLIGNRSFLSPINQLLNFLSFTIEIFLARCRAPFK